ncbi:hypothetical protein CRUP_035406 [Coryphaenoides rupestris]|nr:hypothetical protein CRUP_035406 [Coryphaenoides rupestris]
MAEQAFVTLATNDNYARGAMVLGRSLRNHHTTRKLAVLIGPQVSDPCRGDAGHLAMMKRPDLGLSAAPDPGWPDCFNSGVFVFRPSMETYEKLLHYSTEHGSFDGGDQGVLNGFFSSWSTADIAKHLPFIYNLSSIAIYTYLPAFKQYGANAKVIHFLGQTKPWSHTFDPKARQIQGGSQDSAASHSSFLLDWWTLYSGEVLPMLQQQYGDQPFHSGCVEEGGASSAGLAPPSLSSEERKEKWEQGQADYMGEDSFENIQKKLDVFLK